MSEDKIKNSVDEKPDQRSKHLLSLKPVVAILLKYIFPEIFGEMSASSIIETCMNSDNPDSPYLTLLSEEKNSVGDNKYIKDLVFKITLPKPLTIRGIQFEEILINIESQSDNPNDYVLEIRALIYATQEFLNENKYLKLSTTKKMYQNAIPIFSIWINLDPDSKKCGILTGQFKWSEYFSYAENKKYNIDEDSLITIKMIEIGDDIKSEERNVFTFLQTLLLEKNKEKVIRMFDDYNIELKEEPKMILTAFEQKAYDDGDANGFKRGDANGFKRGEASGFERAIKMRAENIRKDNPDLSPEEALKIAREEIEGKHDS